MQKKSINLLQDKGAPPTFWERFYDWVTNSARIVVIVTESLVLVAFGWRFVLDRKLKDLNDEVIGKGDALALLASEEDRVRDIQDRTTAYSQIWAGASNYTSIVKELNLYVPEETTDLSVSINKTENGSMISVSGQLNRDLIDKLENDIKDSKSFSDVVLSKIERKSGEDIFDFSISAKITNLAARI